MPMGDSASFSDLVIRMSASLGAGLPEGWLCTRTIAVAPLVQRPVRDLPGVDRRMVDRTALDDLVADHAVLLIEKEHAELLHRLATHGGAAEADDFAVVVQHRARRCFLPCEAYATCRSCLDRRRRGEADALGPEQIGRACGQNAAERAEFRDQAFGRRLDIAARAAGEQDQFQKLIVGQGGFAAIEKAPAQSLPVPAEGFVLRVEVGRVEIGRVEVGRVEVGHGIAGQGAVRTRARPGCRPAMIEIAQHDSGYTRNVSGISRVDLKI